MLRLFNPCIYVYLHCFKKSSLNIIAIIYSTFSKLFFIIRCTFSKRIRCDNIGSSFDQTNRDFSFKTAFCILIIIWWGIHIRILLILTVTYRTQNPQWDTIFWCIIYAKSEQDVCILCILQEHFMYNILFDIKFQWLTNIHKILQSIYFDSM